MTISRSRGLAVLTGAVLLAGTAAQADPALLTKAANVDAAYEEDGRHYTAEDIPTFYIAEDGTVGWPTYSGFRRYHSECHVCHGPDGLGSSYAPALVDSVKNLDYYEFAGIVASGRENVGTATENVMPSFGVNKNVMCYLDDIYVYLKARAYGDLARGRPAKHEPKSPEYAKSEDACMAAD